MGNTTNRRTCDAFDRKVSSFGTMSSAYSRLILPTKDSSLEESTLVSASMSRSPEEGVVVVASSSMGEGRREEPRSRLLRCFWRERRRVAMKVMSTVVSVVSVRRLGSALAGAADVASSPPSHSSASAPRSSSSKATARRRLRRSSPASFVLSPSPFVAASRKGSSPSSARCSLRMTAARFALLASRTCSARFGTSLPRDVETNLPCCC
mmetsp:Transcript_17581/g.38344  ORF Transcript_17581/g.38344 Transcript_17581/m.38344 type:complete len:209 (+) Transcript_17581:109-735(+)